MNSGFEIDLITFMICKSLFLLIEDVKDDIPFDFGYFFNICDKIKICFHMILFVGIVNFQCLEGLVSENIEGLVIF